LPEPRVNIVGVGNLLMGDDGVGPAVVARLEARGTPAGVCLYDAGLAFSDVLGMLEPADPLIVIDAVRAGGRPGEVHRLRLDVLNLDAAPVPAMVSLHELSVVPALRLEALAGRVFSDVTVLGVEPGVVDWGQGLSPIVAGAVEGLVDDVLAHACALAPTFEPAFEPAAEAAGDLPGPGPHVSP